MASISAVDLLQFVTNILYLAVFVVTTVTAARHLIRVNVDIALLFGDTALAIAIGWMSKALGVEPSPALAAFSGLLIMALPYLLVRLVDDFAGVAPWTMRIAEVGLALSAVALFVVPQPFPLWLTGALVAYFFIFELYGAQAFVRSAGRSRGVTRRRMQAVAIGSVFLGFVILTAGLQAAIPAVVTLWMMLGHLIAFVSGVAYVVGFAPPGWLRQAWQTPELRVALRQSASLVRLPDLGAVVLALEHSCAEALGAAQAAIGLFDAEARVLRFGQNGQQLEHALNGRLSARAFTTQQARYSDALRRDDPELASVYSAQAALVAPITAGDRRFGVAVVLARRAPIFSGDDLGLVQLLADQMGVILENRLLLEETASERARAEALTALEVERRQVNAMLEARVTERTHELEGAMRELEAFSYSVSHDLRAPLSTIDGFVQAFLDDYGDRIDARGQDYLNRTRSASQRMGHLIDGLLRLSRVTRSEMTRDVVNLSEVAHRVAADLQRSQPGRGVTWTIEDGLMAEGDDQLLRVALENLLGNAWKFTSKRSDARIAFESTEVDGVSAFVVRDDGAGFDMAHADKLFGPFQRLHRRDEFDGTGVGLATVQRIVRRHGGRVWAEGNLDRGAAFFFTLEADPVRSQESTHDELAEHTGQEPRDPVGRR